LSESIDYRLGFQPGKTFAAGMEAMESSEARKGELSGRANQSKPKLKHVPECLRLTV